MRIRSGIMAATLLLVPVFVYAGLVNISGGKCFSCSGSSSDTTPNAFSFTDQTGVSTSSTITSAAVTITGIDASVTCSATGGTVDKNSSGTFASSQSVANNDTIRARHTSSASNSTATNTVVDCNGVSDTFTSTTAAGGGGAALFDDDFTSGNFSHSTGGWHWDGQSDVTVVTTSLLGGTHAARFRFGPDTTAIDDDSTAELRLEWGDILPEVWAGYLLYIPSNYTHRNAPGGNNKGFMTAWDAGGSDTYGNPHVGLEPNFWEQEISPDGSSRQSLYVFGQNSWGDYHVWYSEHPSYFPNGEIGIELADRNKVLEIALHYKYATAANNDGVVEIWKRRLTPTTLTPETGWVKLMDVQSGQWYSVGQEGFGYSYFLGWANSGFTDQTDLLMANFWIGTSDLSGASE